MNQEERAARLLRGQNTPSVIERERMSKEVLERVGAGRTKRSRFRIGLAAAATTGAVALLFVALPGELTPRSAGDGAVLDALCQPGPGCRQGNRLVLRVSNHEGEQGYMAAFAQRSDGTVIWYFPEDESSRALPFRNGEWMNRAVVLGPEHVPGDYDIHAVLSATPIDQGTVRSLVERGGDDQHLLLNTKVRVAP
ncbi:MAG: hypothetical protein ACN4G0_07685 [Polyangiales bacterium]